MEHHKFKINKGWIINDDYSGGDYESGFIALKVDKIHCMHTVIYKEKKDKFSITLYTGEDISTILYYSEDERAFYNDDLATLKKILFR